MDSIIYSSINETAYLVTGIFAFAFIAFGYILAVVLGQKFNKDLPEQYKHENFLPAHALVLFLMGVVVYMITLVSLATADVDAYNETQEKRIEYFHEAYGVNLTIPQLEDLSYPAIAPESAEQKLYGTTTTWLETPFSSGPVEVGLVWTGEKFELIPLGQ